MAAWPWNNSACFLPLGCERTEARRGAERRAALRRCGERTEKKGKKSCSFCLRCEKLHCGHCFNTRRRERSKEKGERGRKILLLSQELTPRH